jgi:hypothetical protein
METRIYYAKVAPGVVDAMLGVSNYLQKVRTRRVFAQSDLFAGFVNQRVCVLH